MIMVWSAGLSVAPLAGEVRCHTNSGRNFATSTWERAAGIKKSATENIHRPRRRARECNGIVASTKVIGGIAAGGTIASFLRKLFESYHALVALTPNFGNQRRVYT